jgi:hypothetical protein
VSHLQRRFLVIADPIQFGAAPKQIFRSLQLSAATRMPECVSGFVRRWRRLTPAILLDAIQEPERGGLPDRCQRSSLKQPARSFPIREHNRIRHRGSAGKDSAGGFNVRPTVDQGIERRNVIAARRRV